MSDPRFEEEKYTGPSLHSAPEMIVSSGPSGPSSSRPARRRKVPRMDEMMYEYQDYEMHDLPPQPVRKTPVLRRLDPQPKIFIERAGPSSSSSAMPVEHPKETRMTYEGKEMYFDEAALARYKEIGRRLCELDASDFVYDNHRMDRKAFMISSRGEEILASVRRNLGVIANKLGDLAEGTIFAHGDELATSFANVNPESLKRLNERVAQKLQVRADAAAMNALISQRAASGMPGTSSSMVKQEELDVKEEPVDDYHF